MSEYIWEQFDRMRQSIGANTRISYELAEALTEGFNRVKGERDALAAHVESARPMVEAYRSQIGGALWALDGEELVFAEAAEEWLVASPETSLARLKAQWQAEVLEQLKYDYIRGHAVGEKPSLFKLIDDELDELRRQAEGGEV